MEAYHEAWLERTGMDREFLEQALRAGFDIHHLDGDHYNNDPKNLVLIFASDHMMLHGMSGTIKSLRMSAGGKWSSEPKPKAPPKPRKSRRIERPVGFNPEALSLAMPVSLPFR